MSGDEVYYHVSYSGFAQDSLKDIAHRGVQAGRWDETRRAFLQMEAWLRADPETLGEPVQDFIKLDQTEYVGVVSVLLVRYSIHLPTRQVFVNRPVEVVRWAGF